MKRAKHTLSNYRLQTMAMGGIYPINLTEVLPGDTIEMSSDALVRCSPLNTPVMHPVNIRIHHWFVPNRILWDGWEKFITGGPDGDDQQTPPQAVSTADKTTLLHYLGVPARTGATVNALPMYAYNTIYNQRYRDQDIGAERALTENTIAVCGWEKDYFTTARPWTQKGPDVTLGLGTSAPVVSSGNGVPTFDRGSSGNKPLHATGPSGEFPPVSWGSAQDTGGTGDLKWNSTKLEADLTQAGAIDINDLRRGFAIQRYQEARARYGDRFIEYLRYLGISPSDARLQEPELCGASVSRLNFSEVLQTTPAAQAGQDGVGDLYGHGIAGVKGNAFRKFFEEHGYLLSVMSVRPKAIYQDGVDRHWFKASKEAYFQKELQHIGQQEILKNELYYTTGQAGEVFGYQDRYDEYRYQPSKILGEFTDTLNTWHLGRNLSSDVALNQSFIGCNPSKRIFQVTNRDPLWVMVNNHIVARRMVGKRAMSRVL